MKTVFLLNIFELHRFLCARVFISASKLMLVLLKNGKAGTYSKDMHKIR